MYKNYSEVLKRINYADINDLEELDLSMLDIEELPRELFSLRNLKKLNLAFNHLKELPKAICALTELEILNLNDNELSELPNSIGGLTSLRGLYLSDNQIHVLPEHIWMLKNLIRLDLENNKLLEFPDTVYKLHNLEALYLSNNHLRSLPNFFENFIKLVELDISSNHLSTLPESFKELVQLKRLSLEDNLFNVGLEIYFLPPLEIIDEILKWQKAKHEGNLQPIHEAKVIFIGESNYGKTHLIELLQKGKIDRKINTTHGIERNQLVIPNKDKDICLNIWDLGGQEFMRNTHQFFFSERSLYVLVTLARRERNELNHWLKLANQLGNKAPVLIVINKIDSDDHDLDRKSLQRDYPNIVGFVRTCIYDCKKAKAKETIQELKNMIVQVIADKTIMPSVYEKRSIEWFKTKEELEKLEYEGKNFITYEEYEKLNFIKDLSSEERKRNLKLLSMIGSVVSFVDDPRLIDTNVINPQWILDGVYAIINDSIVKDKNKGKLCISELERILAKEKFPKSRHPYLLELMKKFNLCYEAKDISGLFYIPDLFEDIEPDFKWTDDDLMHFRYNYDDFSPDSFITKFIVEMHHDIIDEKRWRSGVYISNGSCQAKVYQSYSKNYLNIEIKGSKKDRRSYLYSIRENFRKLHKPFPNLKIIKEVKYKDVWLDYDILVKHEERNREYYHTELDEDILVPNVLNGYTSMYERNGTLKTITIFLASSSELKEDREQFEIFINRENKKLIDQGVFLKLELWEDFIDAMSETRLQDEYNVVVRNSDIFVSLLFTKVGRFTEEEFEEAFGTFKSVGKPLIYTYFKDSPINTGSISNDIKSLLSFQDKLKNLGHYKSTYKNIEDLKLQFSNQLDKVIDNLV